MPDDPDPPRKVYAPKPREFEVVNPPAGAAPPDATPIDVQGHIRAANARGAAKATPTPATAAPLNDVQAILRDNLERANAAGLNDVTLPPKKRSRRTRDFWLMFIPVNAFFAYWAFGPTASVVTFVYGLSGMVLFSAGFVWVMWFVMDDY